MYYKKIQIILWTKKNRFVEYCNFFVYNTNEEIHLGGDTLKYYIGIDGGGTKTAFVIGNSDGLVLKTIEKSGCSHRSIGIDAVVSLIKKGVREILQGVGALPKECAGCCIGLPCFGEFPRADIKIKEKLDEALYPIPVYIVNDAVVGWAGSLECNEGIHLVAGTGALAYARCDDGREARSNGWSEFFSDEGSCYWVGKQAISLFAMEADGRREKGALYDIVKEELDINNVIEFIEIIERDYAPRRHTVASFQIFAKKAALAGDEEARKLYVEAAKHLADSAYGIIKQLGWEGRKINVSYFGGLFKSGALVLEPLKKYLDEIGCTMSPPKRTATEGALLLSIKNFKKE
jgi:N-acetylglucosamine kinase-like BadF-type ATPase